MTQSDVIVVGGGGAGLSAAISAATCGARVVLLEKNAKLGGTTAMSVGSYSAAGTHHQYNAGVNDSVEQFVADMAAANGELEPLENTALRQVLAANAGPTFEWLRSLGLQFLGPTPEPPFKNPRMHNIVPHSTAYIRVLEKEARRRGVVIRTGVRIDKLLRDETGRIVGVSGDGEWRARRGVILATGDYSANAEMKAQHISEQSGRIPPINPGSTGDGFAMAVDAGGRTVNMDLAMEELRFYRPQGIDRIKSLPSGPQVAKVMKLAVERLPKRVLTWFARSALTSWVAPTAKLFPAGAIVVSSAGRRFANEQAVRVLSRTLVDEPDNRCYIVFDSVVAERFSSWPNPISTFPGMAYAYLQDYKKFRPDVIHEAATITGLASQLGVPAAALTATLEEWNESVSAGADAAFARVDLGEGVHVGPFYALGPLGAFVTLTDGGVVVDEQCRVLGSDDVPIPGLHAAGSTGQGGLLLRNHGLHIAWAMTSGRIAGRSAALPPP